jgi:hypothetical protein
MDYFQVADVGTVAGANARAPINTIVRQNDPATGSVSNRTASRSDGNSSDTARYHDAYVESFNGKFRDECLNDTGL